MDYFVNPDRINENYRLSKEKLEKYLGTGKGPSGAFPMIESPLVKLQFLADVISDKVEWARPVYLKLFDPNKDEEAFDLVIPWANSVVLASTYMEVDSSGSKICDQPVIYFMYPQSCTVGILLHEMAHLRYPYTNHGEEFQEALWELKILWNTILHHYGIIE